MKPCHAAALVLVGWYLMVAPAESFKDHTYQDQPLGKWTHQATFDTEFECKRKITQGCPFFKNGEILGLEGPLCYARRIANDDPRLKEK